MKPAPADGERQAIRIDRLLVCLRFAKTRSGAEAMIASHALRRNRQPVLRGSERVRVGDVLTMMLGGRVRIVELIALPLRRGSHVAAQAHYRELDTNNPDTADLDAAPQIPIAGLRASKFQHPAAKDLQ